MQGGRCDLFAPTRIISRGYPLHMKTEPGTDLSKREIACEIPKPKAHHHLICRTCGQEQEIGEEAMAGMFGLVEQRYGFVVANDHLILHATCAACHATMTGEDVAIPRVSGAHQLGGDS